MLAVMLTESKWSENTYQPFLKAIDEKNLSRYYWGQRIDAGDKYIVCENSAYVVRNSTTNAEISRLTISQNEQGIDIENRIEKMKTFYSTLVG